MIYTITTIQKIKLEPITDKKDEKTKLVEFGDRRCIGYFSSLIDAFAAVMSNYKNMHKNMYQFCIIEEMEEGVLEYSPNRYIFAWNKSNHKYEQIDEPIEISKVTNFGIG